MQDGVDKDDLHVAQRSVVESTVNLSVEFLVERSLMSGVADVL